MVWAGRSLGAHGREFRRVLSKRGCRRCNEIRRHHYVGKPSIVECRRALRTRSKEAMADLKVDAFAPPERESRWCNSTFSGTTGSAVRASMRACSDPLCAFIAGAGGDWPSPAGMFIVEPWAMSNPSCCLGSLSAESGDERDRRMSRTTQEVFSLPATPLSGMDSSTELLEMATRRSASAVPFVKLRSCEFQNDRPSRLRCTPTHLRF